jgi:hypothetical protein
VGKAGFVISIVSLAIAASTLALVVTGMVMKKINYFSAD